MKKAWLISMAILLPSCAWIKKHPDEMKQIEMTAEQVALDAARELIKQEYGIILPAKTATSVQK